MGWKFIDAGFVLVGLKALLLNCLCLGIWSVKVAHIAEKDIQIEDRGQRTEDRDYI